jgi:hypothetical protein
MNRLPCINSGVHIIVKTHDLQFGEVVEGISPDFDCQRKRNLSISLRKTENFTSGFARLIQ